MNCFVIQMISHDALLNKSGTKFLKSWRAKFGASRTAHGVDGLTNGCDRAVKFADFFSRFVF